MKKILIILSILSALIIAGTAGVFAAWEWDSKTKSENNTVTVQAYAQIDVTYESGDGTEYDIAVKVSVSGFGATGERYDLYVQDVTYSDASGEVSQEWEYKTEAGEWMGFSSEGFMMEDEPQNGETYTLYLRKNAESNAENEEQKELRFTVALREVAA